MKSDFDVVVVGSGAGGGVVAGRARPARTRRAAAGGGPHRTAADFTRWEAKANHDIWWPLRFAPLPDGDVVALLGGRCVGGTTTINTKVALRADGHDLAKWHAATGLTNERGEPFAAADLAPYYARVEQVLGVRERTDWPKSVRTVEAAFRELGAPLEAVTAYTDPNCLQCGSCLQGCPTNAGKSTMNTYIADALARGVLELRANAAVERVLVEDGRAAGVEYVDEAGERRVVRAGVVVVAGGALNTPQLLLRSGLRNPAIGRHLGLHPVRLVYGLFDEPQDAHMVYPITAHSMAHQHDEDGGFVIEATTIQDPIAFATTLRDESGPFWGQRLVDAGARLPLLERRARDGQRREQRVGRARRGAATSASRSTSSRSSTSGSTRRSTSAASVLEARGREAGRLDGDRVDARPGQLPDGRRPGPLGRRPQRRVARGARPVRRRRLARPAHALGQPVADDHGARDAARRAPRRRRGRLPRPSRGPPR